VSTPDYGDFDLCAQLERTRAKTAHRQRTGPIRRRRSYRANRDQARKSFKIDLRHLPLHVFAIPRVDPVDLQLLRPQHDMTSSFVADIVDGDSPQDANTHAVGELSGEQHRLA
jgi:hypothetical protein